jgi:hypothetical protein
MGTVVISARRLAPLEAGEFYRKPNQELTEELRQGHTVVVGVGCPPVEFPYGSKIADLQTTSRTPVKIRRLELVEGTLSGPVEGDSLEIGGVVNFRGGGQISVLQGDGKVIGPTEGGKELVYGRKEDCVHIEPNTNVRKDATIAPQQPIRTAAEEALKQHGNGDAVTIRLGQISRNTGNKA